MVKGRPATISNPSNLPGIDNWSKHPGRSVTDRAATAADIASGGHLNTGSAAVATGSFAASGLATDAKMMALTSAIPTYNQSIATRATTRSRGQPTLAAAGKATRLAGRDILLKDRSH